MDPGERRQVTLPTRVTLALACCLALGVPLVGCSGGGGDEVGDDPSARAPATTLTEAPATTEAVDSTDAVTTTVPAATTTTMEPGEEVVVADEVDDPPPPDEPLALSALADWSDAVDLPPVGESSNVQDLVVHDGALVAVGMTTVGEDRNGAVWRSSDGAAWEALQPVGLGAAYPVYPTGVVSFEGVLVAVGVAQRNDPIAERVQDDAVGWTSADGGATWEPIAGLPATRSSESTTGITVVDGELWITGYRSVDSLFGYVVLADGTVEGPEVSFDRFWSDERFGAEWLATGASAVRPFLLRSIDGVTWETVATPGLTAGQLHAVTRAGDGTLVGAGLDADGRVVLWRQGDDGTWSVVRLAAPAAGRSVRSVTAWRDSFVVAGGDGSGGVLAPDGTWTPLPPVLFGDLLALDDRLVAVGWSRAPDADELRSHVMESFDGVTWATVGLGPGDFAATLVRLDDRLIAAGTRPADDGARVPAAWSGGARTDAVAGESLAPAVWSPPEVPAQPTADLLRYDGRAWTAVLVNDDLEGATLTQELLSVPRAADVLVDASGAVWVAAPAGEGLFRLLDGTWTRFGPGEGLPSAEVSRLAFSPGGLVVASSRAGLAVFDGTRFVPLALPESLADPTPIDVVAGGGALWVATPSGIASLGGASWYVHGEADGLPVPDVVAGELAAGVATRLWPTDAGVVAELPGIGLAAFDGGRWTVLGVPISELSDVVAVGWDGSALHRRNISELWRAHPDGRTERVLSNVLVSGPGAAVARDGTVWIGDNPNGTLYEVLGGTSRGSGTLGGTRLGRVGAITVIGDDLVVNGGSGVFVRRGGMWTAHVTASGLDYPLGGHPNSFGTGAIFDLAGGPDGTIWALSRQSLPEWVD